MTLHWWMHWFWVTVQFLAVLGNPVPSSTVAPRGQIQSHTTADIASEMTTSVDTEDSIFRQTFRVPKAIGVHPSTNTAVILDRQSSTVSTPVEVEHSLPTESSTYPVNENHKNTSSVVPHSDSSDDTVSQRTTDKVGNGVRSHVTKDTRITWILTTNKTGGWSKYERGEKIEWKNGNRNGTVEDTEDLTVLPLQEEVSRIRLVLNKTKSTSLLSPSSSSSSLSSPVIGDSATGLFNRSDDVEIDDELIEPQLFATAASILEVGVSESTRLSRARSAFPKDYQRDQVQEDRISDHNESNSDIAMHGSATTVDIAAITGSCLATVVLLSTMGSLGFIMYRRRYLNPPQTLNSDKCSNPDSSGYIDDSTIRDNSEEMYSLDNDSFLNSLEAMTIQNFWTDSVKHTKL